MKGRGSGKGSPSLLTKTSSGIMFRLKELENIIENVGQRNYNFQTDIFESYDKIVRAIRRKNVPETDKELFKAFTNHLQVEKHVRKT